jgi:hypothetical protein
MELEKIELELNRLTDLIDEIDTWEFRKKIINKIFALRRQKQEELSKVFENQECEDLPLFRYRFEKWKQ